MRMAESHFSLLAKFDIQQEFFYDRKRKLITRTLVSSPVNKGTDNKRQFYDRFCFLLTTP